MIGFKQETLDMSYESKVDGAKARHEGARGCWYDGSRR